MLDRWCWHPWQPSLWRFPSSITGQVEVAHQSSHDSSHIHHCYSNALLVFLSRFLYKLSFISKCSCTSCSSLHIRLKYIQLLSPYLIKLLFIFGSCVAYVSVSYTIAVSLLLCVIVLVVIQNNESLAKSRRITESSAIPVIKTTNHENESYNVVLLCAACSGFIFLMKHFCNTVYSHIVIFVFSKSFRFRTWFWRK